MIMFCKQTHRMESSIFNRAGVLMFISLASSNMKLLTLRMADIPIKKHKYIGFISISQTVNEIKSDKDCSVMRDIEYNNKISLMIKLSATILCDICPCPYDVKGIFFPFNNIFFPRRYVCEGRGHPSPHRS